MYFDHIHISFLPTDSTSSSQLIPFLLLHLLISLFYFVIQWVSLGLLTGAWASCQWLYHWRNFFLTLEVINYYRSSEKGGVLLAPPSSLAGCWQTQPCVGRTQATRAYEFKIAKAMVMPEDYSPTLPLP